MVKKIDDNGWPESLEHIGILLWRATAAWKRDFDERLVAMGHPWATEARAGVIMHVGRSGVAQAELVRRMRLSKQAVQQLLDGLVADGVVERKPDPADKRGKLIVFTAAGRSFLADANRAKQAIEDDYRRRLGDRRFAALAEALVALEGPAADDRPRRVVRPGADGYDRAGPPTRAALSKASRLRREDPMPEQTPVETLTFEAALKELEGIVQRLEQGKVDLEESIAIYERGEALKRHCDRLLKEAEGRVDKIRLGADGRPQGTEPLDGDAPF